MWQPAARENSMTAIEERSLIILALELRMSWGLGLIAWNHGTLFVVA